MPDLHRLRLDFLPCAERSVQRYGLSLDGIHYYSDVLRRWIGDESGDHSIRKRRFIVRRDPRDISVVFFFDPELNCYFEIPYRDTSRPPLTLWELREVRRRLTESGERQIDEDLIFQAYRRMQTIQQDAVNATRRARRQKSGPPTPPVEKTAAAGSASGPPAEDFGEILPSDEIELW
jgi:putative transposase